MQPAKAADSNDRGKYKLLMFFILCINVLLKEIYWFAAFGHFMPEKFSIIQFRCPMFVDARVLKKSSVNSQRFSRLEIHGALGDSKYFVRIDEISFYYRRSVSFESSKLCVLSWLSSARQAILPSTAKQSHKKYFLLRPEIRCLGATIQLANLSDMRAIRWKSKSIRTSRRRIKNN